MEAKQVRDMLLAEIDAQAQRFENMVYALRLQVAALPDDDPCLAIIGAADPMEVRPWPLYRLAAELVTYGETDVDVSDWLGECRIGTRTVADMISDQAEPADE
jgi:hypothetical protein